MSEIENRLYEAMITIPADLWLDAPLPELFWRPPPAGKFTQLEASDESWARPLGIGELVPFSQIAAEIKERLDRKFLEMLNVPKSLFGAEQTNYSQAVQLGRLG